MRVTQSMLTGNMLRNLNNSYAKMSRLQDQMNTGSKITRPSQDPVIAVKGMSYRVDLAKVEQFQRNINEANTWLDTTDEVLDQVGSQINRIRELVVQAANDTNTEDDRAKIKTEIEQMRLQLKDIANTQIGDKYIFSGTHTSKPLYVDGKLNPELLEGTTTDTNLIDINALDPNLRVNPQVLGIVNAINNQLTTTADVKFKPGVNADFKIDVYENIAVKTNTIGAEVFNDLDKLMQKISEALTPNSETNNGTDISNLLGNLAGGTNISSLLNGIDTSSLVGNVTGGTDATISLGNVTGGTNTSSLLGSLTNGTDLSRALENLIGGANISNLLSNLPNGMDINSLLGNLVGGENIGGLLQNLARDSDLSLSSVQSRVLEIRAEVGARQNRMELMQNRLDYQEINITKQMSVNEDVDYAEAITQMSTAESIHQASLSTGAKIIQQTLVDFMR